MDNDHSLISRILTRWVTYRSGEHNVYLHIQSWRLVKQVRKVQVMSLQGGAHELYARDIKKQAGRRLSEVLEHHVITGSQETQ
jgi:hypothetical protein